MPEETTMKTRALVLALAAVCCAAAASAQVRDRTFEISPFGGYHFGGKFERGTTALFDFDVETDDDFAYGVRFAYNVNSTFGLELQYSRVSTQFVTEEDGELFGPNFEEEFGDLDIDYLLGSMVFNFGHRRAVPYVSLGGGVARLEPDVPGADDETRFTATLGGGVKAFFTPNFGLRFDGRGYATSLTDDNNDRRHSSCDNDFFDDCSSDRREWLTTGEVSLGFIFAF
jgi:opacity protein-like surface antigen